MTDDERRTRQPLSMTRRYRRGLILTGLLCALAVLTAATALFQRSYAERIDNYLMQICHGYAAAYEAQDTHSATTLLNLLPENCPLRITLIDTDGTVLYDNRTNASEMENHAVRPEIAAAEKKGTGEDNRLSETFAEQTFYYAVRLKNGDILRISATADSVFGALSNASPWIVLIILLTLLVAAVLAGWLTGLFLKPIEALDLHDPMKGEAYDELSPLLTAMDQPLGHLPRLDVQPKAERFVRNGNRLTRRELIGDVQPGQPTRLYLNGQFCGIGRFDGETLKFDAMLLE